MNCQKPGELLSYALNSVIDPELLGQFEWESTPDSDNTNKFAFKSFHRFRTFFMRIVNAMSKERFSRNMDQNAVEQFIQAKIRTTAKIRQEKMKQRFHRPRIYTQEPPRVQIEVNLPVSNNEMKEETKLEMPTIPDGESESENENVSTIQWIDENAEGGNKILSDDVDTTEADHPEENSNSHQNENDEENQEENIKNSSETARMEVDCPERSNPKEAIESILDEQDFEFLDS